MALDNYANLRQAIKKWTHREDIDEHSQDCILEAEQEIFYGAVPFRIPEMITEVIESVSAKTFAYPADILEVVSASILLEGCYVPLKSLPSTATIDNNETGTPSAYWMLNGFVLDVEPDKTYSIKIVYYKKPTALSDDNPTNIILQKYPLAYKFGSMSSAFMYAGEEDKANLYALRMRDVIAKANANADNFMMGDQPSYIIEGGIP